MFFISKLLISSWEMLHLSDKLRYISGEWDISLCNKHLFFSFSLFPLVKQKAAVSILLFFFFFPVLILLYNFLELNPGAQ